MTFPFNVLNVDEVILNQSEYEESTPENPVRPDLWFFVRVREWFFFERTYATPVTRHADRVRAHIDNGGKAGELRPQFFTNKQEVFLPRRFFGKKLESAILFACSAYIIERQQKALVANIFKAVTSLKSETPSETEQVKE